MTKSRTYYGEYSLLRWIDLLLNGNIILPEYQRCFVWNERDLYRLIESLKGSGYSRTGMIPRIIGGLRVKYVPAGGGNNTL